MWRKALPLMFPSLLLSKISMYVSAYCFSLQVLLLSLISSPGSASPVVLQNRMQTPPLFENTLTSSLYLNKNLKFLEQSFSVEN